MRIECINVQPKSCLMWESNFNNTYKSIWTNSNKRVQEKLILQNENNQELMSNETDFHKIDFNDLPLLLNIIENKTDSFEPIEALKLLSNALKDQTIWNLMIENKISPSRILIPSIERVKNQVYSQELCESFCIYLRIINTILKSSNNIPNEILSTLDQCCFNFMKAIINFIFNIQQTTQSALHEDQISSKVNIYILGFKKCCQIIPILFRNNNNSIDFIEKYIAVLSNILETISKSFLIIGLPQISKYSFQLCIDLYSIDFKVYKLYIKYEYIQICYLFLSATNPLFYNTVCKFLGLFVLNENNVASLIPDYFYQKLINLLNDINDEITLPTLQMINDLASTDVFVQNMLKHHLFQHLFSLNHRSFQVRSNALNLFSSYIKFQYEIVEKYEQTFFEIFSDFNFMNDFIDTDDQTILLNFLDCLAQITQKSLQHGESKMLINSTELISKISELRYDINYSDEIQEIACLIYGNYRSLVETYQIPVEFQFSDDE